MTKIKPDFLTPEALKILNSGYLLEGETPRDMYRRIAKGVAKWLPEFAEKGIEEDIFEVFWNAYISPSSPVASNFNAGRNLPISCYAQTLPDDVNGLYSQLKHSAMLSKHGGGCGFDFHKVRPGGSPISTGGSANSLLKWVQEFDQLVNTIGQNGLRRGQGAAYIPIDYPDLPEVLRAKDHSSGDPREFVDMNIAVTITDEWMESMLAGDLDKVKLFGDCIETALISGSPYMSFLGNINRANPQCYKDRNLEVTTSNLCNEITLHSDENHTFVCCLSSINLSKWDEWKDWRSPNLGLTVPELGIYLLEAVMSEFIHKSKRMPSFYRATKFAVKSRALGLGVLGYHSLLQSRMLPFESQGARSLNIQVHKYIQRWSDKASMDLAKVYGEPEWCEGSGYRHTHRRSIPPTRTSSVLVGNVSPSIEPYSQNIFGSDEAKGSFVRRNPYLKNLFQEKGYDTTEVWDSILEANGSVQHLDFLTSHEKNVFKTFREIDQRELVRQNADRQPFVDQGISFNIAVGNKPNAQELFDLHVTMWKRGLKGRYYLRSQSAQKKAKVTNTFSNGDKVEWFIITKPGCPYCEDAKEELNSLTTRDNPFREYTKQTSPVGWRDEWKTFPQIFQRVNGDLRHVGGYDDLMKEITGTYGSDSQEECAACEG